MSMTTFWITLVLSNPACIFLGFLFGRMTRATVEIEEHMSQDNDSPPLTGGEGKARRRVTSLRVLGLVVAIIGATTIGLGILVTKEQADANARDARLTACITGYSNALADAFASRQKSNSEASEAVDKVMAAIDLAFGDAPGVGRDRVRQAIKEYNEARAASKRATADHPLPEAPRDACAELLD
jgi:hypothetical protein